MNIDLRDLISHKNWVSAEQSLGLVYEAFACHDFDFMAVLEGDSLLGLCSKRDVGMLLGSKYGFSLFASKPVGEHLLPQPVFVKLGTPVHEVFRAVFARGQGTFYDDVLLVGLAGEFQGLIPTQTLIRLQNRCHLENIGLLERQRREISLKNQQIEADLHLSRELQSALLPIHYPVFPPRGSASVDVFRFHHYYRPVGIVGGDFFHIKKLANLSVGIFVADVMGHGVRSAIITAMLRTVLEGLDGEAFKEPSNVLTHVNRRLARILQQSTSEVVFASALYLLLDAETRTLRYATAGHPSPIHAQANPAQVEILEHPNPGTLLGIFEDAAFSTCEKTYAPGDAVIAFTDGIFEVEDSAGKQFGLGRLCEAVGAAMGHPSGEICDALVGQAESFSANGGFTDDVCLVLVDLA